MKVLINYQLKELKKSKITLIENISQDKILLMTSTHGLRFTFYFSKGKFSGSQNLIFIPQIDVSDLIKTDMPLSPISLYNRFKATNAKALVSMQGLA